MKNKTKGSVSKTVIYTLIISTIIVNFFALCVIGSFVQNTVHGLEEDYLSEIAHNISNSINANLHEYVAMNEVLSKNLAMTNLMAKSSKTNPMDSFGSETDNVVQELASIASQFPSSVINVALMSVAQDGYLLHSGDGSDDSFSFQSRPYYDAVTSRKTYMTAPYLDVVTNSMVVSIASPMFLGSDVIGVVIMDLSIAFVADLVSSSSFRNTGESFVIDTENAIIACHDSSLLGENYSALGVSGSEITSQISTPTGELILFEVNGVTKIGTSESVGNYGWKIVTYIDEDEFQTQSNYVLTILISMLIFTTIIIVITAARTVTISLCPIESIKTAMRELASGNLHYELSYQSSNEIGDLAHNMRRTSEKLAIYINEIERQLSLCGKGDFTVESNVKFEGDFADIENSIQEFIRLISQTLAGLKSTIDQVTQGSDYVATGSQNLAEGSAEQSESIKTLNGYISDITTHIYQTADNAKGVNKAAQVSIEELGRSNDKMTDMVRSMDEINQKSLGINSIVKTIEDVAFQTNILALNAAVEAARAGVAGKGFAVVADEVRNLSARTSEAVQSTTHLIDETVEAVGRGSKIAEDTAESLQAVTADIYEFMKTLEDITTASQEQATDIDHIHQGITDISNVMETNSDISQKSAATSQELSSQASVMKETIDQFKTPQDQLNRKYGF